MLLEDIMQCFCIISHWPSPPEQMFHDIQLVILMNFVVVSSVSIKRVDCIPHDKLKSELKEIINQCFFHKNGNRRFQYVVIGYKDTYFVRGQSLWCTTKILRCRCHKDAGISNRQYFCGVRQMDISANNRHSELKSELKEIINQCFFHKNGNRRFQYVVIGYKDTYFVRGQSLWCTTKILRCRCHKDAGISNRQYFCGVRQMDISANNRHSDGY